MVVELWVSGSVIIDWRAPRLHPPGALLLSSDQLRGSKVWADLLERWLALPGARALDLDANPRARLPHEVSIKAHGAVKVSH